MNAHNGSYALSAGAAKRSAVFRGTRACMFEAAQPQVASPPEKPRGVREVWRSQTCARSRLSFASFPLAKQRKRGLRRKTSFCEAKTKPSLEGFVLTKLKQDLLQRACFCAAKRVPRAGIRRNGKQGRREEGYLKFGKPPEPQPSRMLCGLSLAKSLIKNTLRL